MYDPDDLKKTCSSKIIHKSLCSHSTSIVAVGTIWHIKYFFIALGSQDGEVSLLKYDTDSFLVQNETKIKIDGPISSILLLEIESEIVDLLVVSATGYCVLYRDIVQNFLERKTLIEPASNDALTSAAASDIDFDGEKEILIGTFAKEVFCYKIIGNLANLLWKLEFMHPVLSICEIDINKDGVNEVVIVSMYGITILTPNLFLARNKLQAISLYLNGSS